MNWQLIREWAVAIGVTAVAVGILVAVHLMPRKVPARFVPQPAPVLREVVPVVPAPVRETAPLPRARPKAKHKPVTKALPSSPYPCPLVRLAISQYDRATLDSMARARGLTAEQIKAAIACEKG